MIGKSNYLYRISFVFLCLGLISGIVFYSLNIQAESVTTSITITTAACGDGTIQGSEECDDGNTTSGDGCSSSCEIEVGAVCGDGTCNGDETCSSCSTDCGACAPGGGGGGGGGGVLPPTPTVTTKVILIGKASPAAYLTVLKDGRAIGNTQANTQSDFRIEISNITAGVYTFGIWAEDKLGIKSLTFSFTVNVVSGVSTTVSGIFLPPTINLDRDSVKRGETLNISGTTAPQSQVEVHINSDEIIEKLSAGIDGAWFYTFDTSRVAEGTHSIRAKASTKDGLLSTFSQIKLFGVGVSIRPGEMVAAGADLNGDNKVNLIDFSILLYWWGRPSTTSDLNNDGVVNLIDFSIMMYWWTG